MKPKQRTSNRQETIDNMVVAQADDNSAWENPIVVRRDSAASLALPKDLAARAAFFARLHRSSSVADWVTRVLKERLDVEEAVFGAVKRALKSRHKT
jgi:hypothetical protein